MKRSLALILAAVLLLSGCNQSIDSETTKAADTTEISEFTTAENDSDVTESESSEDTSAESETDDVTETESETETETETETIVPHEHDGDPYLDMSEEEFYSNYETACCYVDALYRSQHYFLSGEIYDQDQCPDIAADRPMDGDLFVRNTSCIYEDDGNTYCVLDADGGVVNRVYKGGAYIVLEEVAAYVFAFGEIPANYSTSKNTKPTNSPWGIYLRLNHSKFSGSTTKYPYEPELPNISGCGGDLTYYEMDIGTTGTDCDPGYDIGDYNNGTYINRGAARIVYTVYDKNGDKIIDPNEKYLFYTYNHYNDFQEYLNYEGGWGKMFGNITGGGTLSSKYDYNPTPYIPTAREEFFAA